MPSPLIPVLGGGATLIAAILAKEVFETDKKERLESIEKQATQLFNELEKERESINQKVANMMEKLEKVGRNYSIMQEATRGSLAKLYPNNLDPISGKLTSYNVVNVGLVLGKTSLTSSVLIPALAMSFFSKIDVSSIISSFSLFIEKMNREIIALKKAKNMLLDKQEDLANLCDRTNKSLLLIIGHVKMFGDLSSIPKNTIKESVECMEAINKILEECPMINADNYMTKEIEACHKDTESAMIALRN